MTNKMNNSLSSFVNRDLELVYFCCIDDRRVFMSYTGSLQMTGSAKKTIAVDPPGGPRISTGDSLDRFTGESINRIVLEIEILDFGVLFYTTSNIPL